MSDVYIPQPVRTLNPGDVKDIMVDATTPTQGAKVDTHGSQQTTLANAAGTVITSQSNGGQQAIDVGIDVAGVQIDPRQVGQYNSSLPTLSTGTNAPLAVDSNGRLLTVPETDVFPSTQAITAQDTGTTSTVSGNQTFYTGSPTAGSFATFSLGSEETVMLETTGTWTGTLQSEISVDSGTTWVGRSIHLIGSPNFVTTFTTNVIGSGNIAAKTNFRVRAISTWTGTATIKVNLSTNQSTTYIANPIKLVDASSPLSTIQANILASTTAASTTNTSLVVALSPNSPLPAGTSLLGSVNQGTSPWIVKDQADGSVTGGTAGTSSLLGGLIYNSVAPTLTTGQQVGLQGDASGNLKVDLQTAIPAGSAIIGKIEITDGTNVVGVTPASTAALATQPAEVVALSPNTPLPSGTNLIGATNTYVGGTPVSNSNPVPVYIADTIPGLTVNSYHTTASLAAAGIANHVYTITTGKTFTGRMFFASGSGKIRADVQTSPNGSTYTTFWTAFSSPVMPNIQIALDNLFIQDSGAGSTVQIVITNEDNQTFDVFSTISGQEN